MSRAIALLAAVAVLLGARVAGATPTARLVYSRASDADSCPDEATLRHAVAARIGYDPFFPWAARTVVASLARRDAGFVATVDLIDERGIAHGARELRGNAGCGELLDTVALTIAIAIDPQSLVSAPAPAPAPALDRTPASPSPEPQSPMFEASAGAVASTGVAPGPSAGLSLGADLRWGAFSLGLEGRADAPVSMPAKAGGGRSLSR